MKFVLNLTLVRDPLVLLLWLIEAVVTLLPPVGLSVDWNLILGEPSSEEQHRLTGLSRWGFSVSGN